jgi:hypothetical protein
LHDVGPGEAICIPRGAIHQFANRGDLDAKALAIVTPGILGPDYFREVAAVFDAAAGGPPDLAAIAAGDAPSRTYPRLSCRPRRARLAAVACRSADARRRPTQ